MVQLKRKYTEIAKKCTCGVLVGVIVYASISEISECPIYNNKNCQTQHIEQPYVSLGTVNNSATFAP